MFRPKKGKTGTGTEQDQGKKEKSLRRKAYKESYEGKKTWHVYP
jgi:hypothetical protein